MAKFQGLKRETLEGAGSDGKTAEVDIGLLVDLNPTHPETERALRVGSIQPAPEKKPKTTGGGD